MRAKKSSIKNIVNISFIAILTIGVFVYTLKADGIENIIEVIKNVNIYWMIAGLVCMILYWLIESLKIYKKYKKNCKYKKFI